MMLWTHDPDVYECWERLFSLNFSKFSCQSTYYYCIWNVTKGYAIKTFRLEEINIVLTVIQIVISHVRRLCVDVKTM